jgi:AbrB family looped-hinge helix DNA binding protein
MAEQPIAVSRMTTRGRVTVPKVVREEFGLNPGDEVDFVPVRPGRLRIVKVGPKAAKPAARA